MRYPCGKVGTASVCPIQHHRPMASVDVVLGKLNGAKLSISRAQGRVGALRADVRSGPGAPRGLTGPPDECVGARRPAWCVLHEPAQSDRARDGSTDRFAGVDAREGIDAIGDGRNAESARRRWRALETHVAY